MESNKTLAPAAYFLGLVLFCVPFVDALTAILPTNVGQERWRFGAVGSLSNATLLPLIGLFIAVMASVLLDHRRVRKFIGVICAGLALMFAVAIIMFVLDFFQMRNQVKPELKRLMDIASLVAAAKQTVTIITLVLLAWVGLSGPKAAHKSKRPSTEGKGVATPLIPVGDHRSE